MDGAFILRQACAGDEQVILQFIHELAEYEKLSHQVSVTTELLRGALFGASPQAEALIAEGGAQAIGYALWFFIFDSFTGKSNLFVEDLFVALPSRGLGVGRAIFRRLARRAVERGCAGMAWKVLDWNAAGIGFYRRLGAAPDPGWTIYGVEGPALTALAA